MISFNDYQKKILTFVNPETMETKEGQLLNGVLGLVGEAGEVADLIKKWCYHKHDLDKEKISKELGDIQFYIALAANAFDIKLEDIAVQNIDKLNARYPTGVFTVEDSKEKKDELLSTRKS